MWHLLAWSHIKDILPINDKNKRNYYVNLCISKTLSVRELKKEIKNNSYERLVNKPDKIDVIQPTKSYSLLQNVKNPILIELNGDKIIESEHDLEITILSQLQFFFQQLENGFAYMGNQYKINCNNKNYFIDILLFNVKINCYVVVELKLRELKKEDKC